MTDLSPTTTPSARVHIFRTIKQAWQMVHGFKGPAWGAFAFLILIALGITVALTIAVVIALLASNTAHITAQALPTGLLISLRVALSLITDFFLLPLMVGLLLLSVHRLKGRDFTVYRIFDYYKWRYMWRFFVNLLIFSAILILILIGMGGVMILHAKIANTSLASTPYNHLYLIIFSLFSIYISAIINFANMLIAEKSMPLWRALGTSTQKVSKHFFGLLGTWLLVTVIFTLVYMIAFLIALFFSFLASHALMIIGLILGITFFILGFIWFLPFSLNVIGLLYSQLFGLDSH